MPERNNTNNNCPYIPHQKMSMVHKQVDVITQTFATSVTQRGWRRFGRNYLYPACGECIACKNLRIDVNNYHYSKSQRKIINRNDPTKIHIQTPTVTDTHLALYNKYHRYKAQKDGWSHRDITQGEYYDSFVSGARDFGKELHYYIDEKLVAIDLIDILDDGISSIYCYYDPDYPRYSLGTYSLLYEINLAQMLGLDWVYLGYWVEGCKSFAYKEKFQPLQILEGYPPLFEKPNWKPWVR